MDLSLIVYNARSLYDAVIRLAMTNTLHFASMILLAATAAAQPNGPPPFGHPGILHNKAELPFIKARAGFTNSRITHAPPAVPNPPGFATASLIPMPHSALLRSLFHGASDSFRG